MKNSLRSVSSKAFLGLFLLFSLSVTSCGDNGGNVQIPGLQGPYLTAIDDGVLVDMVFDDLMLDGGIRYEIPNYQASYIELGPDLQSGGTYLAIFVAFVDIYDNDTLKYQDPQTLPGGRPFPGLRGGRLPAVAFAVPSLFDMVFYLGNSIYGIFIPFDLGIQGSIATFRFYTDGQRVGNISLVGEDENGENSGVLLALDTQSRMAKVAQRIASK